MLVGAVLSCGIAGAGAAVRVLTWNGAIAAIAVGTLVFGFGGWQAAALLATFFATSSLLTRWHAERKTHPEHGAGRTAGQVLANGLVATVLAVWSGLAGSPGILAALAAAVATSTADTWATEVGMLSPMPPRLITTWRPVPRGSSGAITPLGTVAGFFGACLIAGMSWGLLRTSFVTVAAAAVMAMLFDSLLGATVESRIRFVDNNAVNLLATAAGAALALAGAGR